MIYNPIGMATTLQARTVTYNFLGPIHVKIAEIQSAAYRDYLQAEAD